MSIYGLLLLWASTMQRNPACWSCTKQISSSSSH